MSYHKFILPLFLLFFIFGCSTRTPISHKKPEIHPNSPATMRPYTINGKTYYPEMVKVGDKERGIARWYGPNFHGKRTSNGEVYNMNSLSAAHKTFPMNTMVKVTNLDNGKNLIVRINDRGPFVSGRVIDLSKLAASKLGIISTGTAPVEIEVMGFSGKISANNTSSQDKIYVGGKFMVQIGAFRNLSGAKIYESRAKYNNYSTTIREFYVDGLPFYRVFITGFKSENEARDFVKTGHFEGSFIVRE